MAHKVVKMGMSMPFGQKDKQTGKKVDGMETKRCLKTTKKI